MTFIATFYSHFDAIRMRRALESREIPAKLMPVPRDLSSSCGTCLRFETEEPLPECLPGDAEKVVLMTAGGYQTVFAAEDSP